MPEKLPRGIKYAWALVLSLTVTVIAVSEKDSPWQPLLNALIDAIQLQMRADPPALPGAGEIPTGPGPLHFPTRQKVSPAAAPVSAIAPPDMATAGQ